MDWTTGVLARVMLVAVAGGVIATVGAAGVCGLSQPDTANMLNVMAAVTMNALGPVIFFMACLAFRWCVWAGQRPI